LTSEITGGVTVSQILKQAVAHLRSVGIAAPKLDAWLLFERSSGMEKSEIIAHPERIVDGRDQQVFLSLVARRAAREPVSRILGIREFYSRDFEICEATLDPRPDTETLIDQALALTINSGSDALRICDFGTGSGILLVTLLAEWPGCLGFGVDIDENAVRTARLNACRHGVAERAQFCVADWDAALDGYFDVIVSNPPYIVREQIAHLAPEVREYDPLHALDGGQDGLDAHRAIISAAARLLRRGDGVLIFEIGSDQVSDVMALLGTHDLQVNGNAGIRRDLSGRIRVITACKV